VKYSRKEMVMKRRIYLIPWVVFIILLLLPSAAQFVYPEETTEDSTFFISGTVLDSHKEPVKEAHMKIFVNGQPQKFTIEGKETDEIETSSHGTYQVEFNLPSGWIDTSKIELEISKSSYRKSTVGLTKEDFAQKGQNFYLSI
jgi:hypothetical protein